MGHSLGSPSVSNHTALPLPFPKPLTSFSLRTVTPSVFKTTTSFLAKERVVHPAVPSGNLQRGRMSSINATICVQTVCKTKGGGDQEEPKDVPGTFPKREAKM